MDTDMYTDQIANIKQLIAKGDDIYIPADITNSVIIIGNTGSGKSTLLNYLSGMEMSAIPSTSKISNKFVIDVSDQKNVNCIKINHTTISDTTVPNVRLVGDTLFADCPGFSNNRGYGQDIANAYYIKRILRASPRVKVIIVMEIEMFTGRALKFFDLIDLLSEMFSNITKIQHGMMIMISKVDPNVTTTSIIEHLKTIRADHIQHLTPVQIRMIDFFINSSTKIALFHRPSKIGLLGDTNRQQVMQKLSTFDPIDSTTIKISVSDKSKVFVIALLAETNKKIIEINEKLCAHVCDNITNQTNELCKNIYSLIKNFSPETVAIETLDKMIRTLKMICDITTKNLYQIDDILRLGLHIGAMIHARDIEEEMNHFNFFSELNPIKDMDYENRCICALGVCSTTIENQIKTATGKIVHRISDYTELALSDFFVKLENSCIRFTKKMPLDDQLIEFFQLGRDIQFTHDHLFDTNNSASNLVFDLSGYKHVNYKLSTYNIIMQKYADNASICEYYNRVGLTFDNLTRILMENLIKKQTTGCTIL